MNEPTGINKLDQIEKELKDEKLPIVDDPKKSETGPEATILKKRRRKLKPKSKIDPKEVKPLVLFFSFALESMGLQALNEDQINRGADAWLPVYEKYLSGGSIWIAPALWTASVAIERREVIYKKAKDAVTKISSARSRKTESSDNSDRKEGER